MNNNDQPSIMFQQIGEIVGTVRSIQSDTEGLRDEVSKVRHAQNNASQELISVRNVLGSLTLRVETMEKPVEDIRTMRAGLRGLTFVAVPVVAIARYFYAPIRDWLTEILHP